MNRTLKSIVVLSSALLILSAFFYFDYQYGLLSMAGLNGKGLPTKTMKGSLSDNHIASDILVNHSEWDKLLKKYVDYDGKVDYKGFLQEKNKLNEYLNMLSKQVPINAWSGQEQLAYYINLYNAHTVNLILDNYPVKSIKDIHRPWAKEIITIGNKELSLGALEHSILRKMNEPRIHFAINCASNSCPKLLNEAFTAENLEEQLNTVTLGFINSANNTITPNKVTLSKIFNWYKDDFFNGDLIKYVNQYSESTIAPGLKIRYQKYDWNLNRNYKK